MLRWLVLVGLALAAGILVFTNPLKFHRKPNYVPPRPHCQAHAWVRAPDMVPGDVIAGDVRIKLDGPCTEVESYELGLRYKEKIFWKLRPEPEYGFMDATRDVFRRVRMPFQNSGNPHYNEMQLALQLAALRNSGQNKDLRSVHEEERIAFEIKTPLVGAEGADPLSRSFTSRFGILVPNTNYPPGLDYRHSGWNMFYMHGDADVIHSESIYEYFVEIRFSNGMTWKVPAGITAFTPFYLSTENNAPSVNISLAPRDTFWNSQPWERSVDRLWSNYSVEVSFPEGAHIYQNSSVNITATVHRTGYTNRTDIPVELCASPASAIEWRLQELKNRSQACTPFIKALVPSTASSMVPSMQHQHFTAFPPFSHSPCREIKFAAAPANLTHEGHISSTSSEPLALSIHVGPDAVQAFSTYYQKLGHRVNLNLHVKPDPSEPWEHNFMTDRWEQETGWMDETDFDWVPWSSPIQARRRYLTGNVGLSSIPMQKQRPVQAMPVHYLRSMTIEERDLLAPIAQPSIKVFESGRVPSFYFDNMGQPGNPWLNNAMGQYIYVGDTWLNKVLPVAAEVEGQHVRDMGGLLDVQ